MLCRNQERFHVSDDMKLDQALQRFLGGTGARQGPGSGGVMQHRLPASRWLPPKLQALALA